MFRKLIKKQELINRMFEEVVEELKRYLPDFGRHLAIDSKKIETYAHGRRDSRESSDPEADWGYKTYNGKRADGSLWEKISSWFGYKLHLLVDVTYELPVGYRVTKASRADIEEMIPLVKDAKEKHFREIETLAGDKAYDSAPHNEVLYDEHGRKPVIDIQDTWGGRRTEESSRTGQA